MLRLISQRLVAMVPLLFIVSLVTFSITDLLPGDPAQVILGQDATPAQVALVRERLGLDQSWLQRYGAWIAGVAQGDLGTSYFNSVDVVDSVRQRLPVTLSLTFGSMVVASVIGITAGVVAATRRASWVDRVAAGSASIGQAIPNFWFALILVAIFAVYVPLFPATGYVPVTESPVGWLRSITLPSIALGTSAAAVITRQTRGGLADVLSAEYVRAATAQGIGRRRVLVRHALRNALIPVVTVVGFQITILLGGAIIVEQVFAMNGLGSLAVTAVRRQDVPMVQGLVLVSVVVVVLVQLATDLLYAWLDPKARPA